MACVATQAGRPGIAARLLPDVGRNSPQLGVFAARVRDAVDPPETETELAFVAAGATRNGIDAQDSGGCRQTVQVQQQREGVVYSGLEAFRRSRRSTPGYGTRRTAPVTVAAARDHAAGDDLLSEYTNGPCVESDTSYRDRSLWVILQAVACLPNPNQALACSAVVRRRICAANQWFAEALSPSVTTRRGGDGAALPGTPSRATMPRTATVAARGSIPDQSTTPRPGHPGPMVVSPPRALGATRCKNNGHLRTTQYLYRTARRVRARRTGHSRVAEPRDPRKPPWCACQDPAFVPIVAAWLSARIVGRDLTPDGKGHADRTSGPRDRCGSDAALHGPRPACAGVARRIDVDRVEAACRLVETTEPPTASEYSEY